MKRRQNRDVETSVRYHVWKQAVNFVRLPGRRYFLLCLQIPLWPGHAVLRADSRENVPRLGSKRVVRLPSAIEAAAKSHSSAFFCFCYNFPCNFWQSVFHHFASAYQE